MHAKGEGPYSKVRTPGPFANRRRGAAAGGPPSRTARRTTAIIPPLRFSMILNPINQHPRFVRTMSKGSYKSALVAAATSAPLTEEAAWLTGGLRFSWRIPERIAPLVPPAAWAALVDALDGELRRDTQRLWLHLVPCYVGLALSTCLIAPGAALLWEALDRGPRPGKSRVEVDAAPIALLMFGFFALLISVVLGTCVGRGNIELAQQEAAVRACHLVNSTLAPQFVAAVAAANGGRACALCACFCPLHMPVEYRDDDSDCDGEDFSVPDPAGAEGRLTAPTSSGHGCRRVPVLHVALGVPAFQHPLYETRCGGESGRENEYVFADEVSLAPLHGER